MQAKEEVKKFLETTKKEFYDQVTQNEGEKANSAKRKILAMNEEITDNN